MQIKQKSLAKLFMACGYAAASNWDADKLADKVSKIDELIDDDSVPDDEDSAVLLKKIKRALRKGEDIEIIPSGTKSASAAAEKPKKKLKKKVKPAPVDEDEEEDDSDEEEAPPKKLKKKLKKNAKPAPADDDDEEDEKPKKKAKAPKEKKAKAPKEKKVGVIASIQEFLEAADEDNPITKPQLLKKLCKRFPDNGEASMKVTMTVWLPGPRVEGRFKSYRDLNVWTDGEGGYWMPNGGAKPQKKGKSKPVEEEEEEAPKKKVKKKVKK